VACSVTGVVMRVTLRTHDIPLRETRKMDMKITWTTTVLRRTAVPSEHIAHLGQRCHNSKCVIFQERILKLLKCYNFLWVQRRHNCSPAASFANCVMTLYPSKVHLQTFLSKPITQKCQILSCDSLVTNQRYGKATPFMCKHIASNSRTDLHKTTTGELRSRHLRFLHW
jgi:hypothetical protein